MATVPEICAIAQTNSKDSAETTKPSDQSYRYYPDGDTITAGDIQAVHAELVGDDALQFERPVVAPDPPNPAQRPPAFFVWLGRFLSSLGPLFQGLFYIGVGLIGAAILYFIFRRLPHLHLQGLRRRQKLTGPDEHVIATVQPDREKARAWLEEADALARDGKFSEAVHLLLFRSIDDLQDKQKKRISAALTAREIARIEGMPPRPRKALAPIIELVERSFFGGDTLGQEHWSRARGAYEDFAFGEGWT